jgi:Zn-dependent protease
LKALLLVLFGGLKFGKILSSGGTMLLSLLVYAGIWGWRYAAGFIALLFIHELGHYLAARQRGLDVGLPTFIPFVGAWIEMNEQLIDDETEAYVAAGGPFLGTIASVATYLWSQQIQSSLLLAIAYSGLFLNLFNLLPVSPLDGGRITAVLSPRVWLFGAPLMVAAFIYNPSPVLILVAVVAMPQLIRAWKFDPSDPENSRYYNTTLTTKLEYGAFYLGLAAFLALMTYDVHEMLAHVRRSP